MVLATAAGIIYTAPAPAASESDPRQPELFHREQSGPVVGPDGEVIYTVRAAR